MTVTAVTPKEVKLREMIEIIGNCELTVFEVTLF
jgi:hypothetical protein